MTAVSSTRVRKLTTFRRTLQAICDLIAPDNAFALYTLAAVQQRLDGAPAPDVLDRLRRQHDESPFWRARLDSFGLDLDRLAPPPIPSSPARDSGR